MSQLHVLMCCHNGETYVEAQLRSIVGQQRRVHRLHVHDFASSDSTIERVRSLLGACDLPASVVAHADAPGPRASFWRALQQVSPLLADDDIVLLSDQDDVWMPDKTSAVMQAFDRSAAEFAVFHDVQVVDSELRVMRPTYYSGKPWSLPRDLDPERLLLGNPVIGHTLSLSAPLIRRALRMADAQRYLIHDWLLALFASRFGVLRYVDRPLSMYRQHGTNVLGAYGRRGTFATARRAIRFADAAAQQAIAFCQDERREEHEVHRLPVCDQSLAACVRRSEWAAYAWLARSALRRGPTLQRKSLSVLIAAQGVRRKLGLARAAA